MKVYHGSYVEIGEIDLSKSEPNRDFGRGFYILIVSYIRVHVDLFSQVAGVTPKGSNLHNRRQAQRSLRTRTTPHSA